MSMMPGRWKALAMTVHEVRAMLAAAGARAVLVSSGKHVAGSRLQPVPTAQATTVDLGRCLVERAGLDRRHLTVLADPASPQELSAAAAEAAGEATDVLVVWYVGHGLVGAAHDLYLATRATVDLTAGVPEYQALPYSTLKAIIGRCRARLIVVGLDCCFSGRAEGWVGDREDPLDAVRQRGVYVLASGGRDDPAWAPPGGYTAFTGAVIRLLTDGDPAAPAYLTLDDVYQCLTRALPATGLPRPRRYVADEVDALPLAPNPAYRRSASAAGRPDREHDRFSPYRGLAAFEPEDARFFFGREELTRTVLDQLAERRSAGCPLVVTGPSGCGKSSLLRAGLVSALHQMHGPGRGPARPPVLLMTPGSDPFAGLLKRIPAADGTSSGRSPEGPAGPDSFVAAARSALSAYLAGQGTAHRSVVIVVDQFEEIFAPGITEAQRDAFIGALCAVCGRQTSADPLALVVLGVRADFFGHCARYPRLVRSLESAVVVGPMTTEQLRNVITKPAELAGLTLEDGLTDLVLEDVENAGHPTGGPAGALPLLSHALLVTWQQRDGSRMTLAGYHASAGIARSLARTADVTLGRLDLASQQIARRLLLQLVQLGEGTEATGRTMPISELQSAEHADPVGARHVLDVFVQARLLTVGTDTVQITHEALLRAWPLFRAWIDADRADLLASQQLARDADTWDHHGHEPAYLYHGSRLAGARAAAGEQRRIGVTAMQRAFLDASSRRERRGRRARRLTAALTALALMGTAAYAFRQQHDAVVARVQADSRAVAAEADQIRREDPSLAAQLSIAAYRLYPTQEARASLLESAAYPAATRFRDSAGPVQAVALAPGHRVLAVTAKDGTVRLWSLTRPGHPVPLGQQLTRPGDSPVYAAAFNPAGHLLATAGAAGTISLWQVADPRHAVPIGRPLTGSASTVYSVAFSPGGRLLAAGSADGTVRLWNVTDPQHPVRVGIPLTGRAGAVLAVAFSPDGRLLAAGCADKTVRIWNVATPRHPVPVGRLVGPADTVDSVAFSPDGQTLAAGSRDHTAWLWHLGNPPWHAKAGTPLTGATDWVNAIAFSPDGQTLAEAGGTQVLLRSAATGAVLAVLPGPQAVTSLAWDGERALIAGNADGDVRLWRLPSPIIPVSHQVNGVAFSPDGNTLAVAGPGLQLWDPRTRTQISQVTSINIPTAVAWDPAQPVLAVGYSDSTVRLWRADADRLTDSEGPLTASRTGLIESLAFRPGGRVLAAGADDGTIRLWAITGRAHPKPLAVIHDSRTSVYSVAFSPDGRTLAAASGDNLTRLFDVARPARPRSLGQPLARTTSYDFSVAFSPDGRTLAIASADKTVRLWDISIPRKPHAIGTLHTNPGGYAFWVTFNPSGTMLAAGSTDGSAWIWDLAKPANPALIAHVTDTVSPGGIVYTLAFSPDGNTLAVGSNESVRLWDTHPTAAAAKICATAGQPLTRTEWNAYIPGRPYSPPCDH
jgi:WD40 repeat protein